MNKSSRGREEVSSLRPPQNARRGSGAPVFKSWVADPTSSALGKRLTRSHYSSRTPEENMKVEIVPGGRNKNAQSPSPPPKEEQDLETGHVFDEMELLDSSEKSSTCSEDSLDDDYKPKGYRAVKPVGRIRKLKTEHNARKTSLHKKLQESKGSPRSDRPLIKHLLEGLSPGCAYNLSKPEKRSDLNPRDIYIAAAKYSDSCWKFIPGDDNNQDTCIRSINASHPLKLVTEANIRDQGHITGMTLSLDGTMLATFSTVGVIRIWDLETFKSIKTLIDKDEGSINEFYVGRFLPDTCYLAAAGKLKDPKKWSTEDGDNHILPTPIKIFDIITGEVVNTLYGHEEEVLCLKDIVFKDQNYLITTSQDGYIMKWSMQKGWVIEDGETCMAFNVSFLPNTANRLFVAACDNHVALFDFEAEQKIQKFDDLYSCYCDYVMVVSCPELEPPRFPDLSQFLQNVTLNIDSELSEERLESCFTYILSRGVEEVEEIDGVPINTIPNVVCLHKLKYKTEVDGEFTLEEIRKFHHPEYRSNSWLIKIDSNGFYVAAPTYEGSVFFFNLASGECAGILRDHDEVEVRDVLFHPTRKLFFSCADDGTVKVYTQDTLQAAEVSSDDGPCCSR